MLTVVDSFIRECPAIEVDTGLFSRRVTRVLEWIFSRDRFEGHSHGQLETHLSSPL